MRTLFDIIEAAKDGHQPTHEECYFAMLAFDALWAFDRMELCTLADAAEKASPSLGFRAKVAHTEAWRRNKLALQSDPQKWLGDQVPSNPAYQRMRDLAFKVAEKATGVDLRGPVEPVPPP